MPTFAFTETTTASPEAILRALTDFGGDRHERFPNSAAKFLVIHDRGATSAEVTEGSSGVWERLHYDWSDPHDVKMRTVDSNAWGGQSGHRWKLKPLPDGGTRLGVVVVRDPKNPRGRVVSGLLRLTGKRLIGGQLRGLLKGLEQAR